MLACRLGADARGPVSPHAKPSDAQFGSQRQRGAHGADVRQDGRIQTPDLEAEGDQDAHQAAAGPEATGVADKVPTGRAEGHVLGPAHQDEGRAAVGEQVGHQNTQAGAGGVLVGEELVVDQVEAEEVRQEDDGRVGRGRPAGDVRRHIVDGLEVAHGLCGVDCTGKAAGTEGVGVGRPCRRGRGGHDGLEEEDA